MKIPGTSLPRHRWPDNCNLGRKFHLSQNWANFQQGTFKPSVIHRHLNFCFVFVLTLRSKKLILVLKGNGRWPWSWLDSCAAFRCAIRAAAAEFYNIVVVTAMAELVNPQLPWRQRMSLRYVYGIEWTELVGEQL